MNLLASSSADDLSDEFCLGLTPLQYAAKTNGATISVLLGVGADPKLPHKSTGTTPLMFASRSGDVDAVETLLGVLKVDDVDVVDEHGATALGLCSLTCNAEVAKSLISAGADVFKPDSSGNSPLHVGAFYCSEALGEQFANTLLEHDPTKTRQFINMMSIYGRTALMLAAKQGNFAYYDTLTSHGADEEIISSYDKKTVQDFKLEYHSQTHDL